MPHFSRNAVQRIANVVRTVEATYASNVPETAQHSGCWQPWLQWYELAADFDPDTGTADAHPVNWNATLNSNDGDYTVDTDTTRKIRDTTGQSTARTGDWVLCRPIGSRNGTVWEVLTAVVGGIKYGKLDASWTSGTATVSIWTWSGSAWEDSTENVTATMPPWITSWSIALDAWVKLDYHSQSGQWHADPKVSQAVLTSVQIDTSDKKLEKKTRTVVGPFVDAESAWTDVYSFVAVDSPLVDLQADTDGLETKSQKVWVVFADAATAWETVAGGTTATVITDLQIVDASRVLQQKTQVVTILAAAAKSAWTTFYTGEPC